MCLGFYFILESFYASGADRQKNPTVSGRVARRTKGGLLPWWVRKRLQEQTGTTDGVVEAKLSKPRRNEEKSRLKNVQVGAHQSGSLCWQHRQAGTF